MPLVTIIVPSYNHACFLRERLDTILSQTFQDFELILLDDASTDESRAILREYARRAQEAAPVPHDVRLELNETNSGSTFKQWNKGVRMARGKYVWIAESDDYSDARFLERMVAILEADERIAISYCRSHRVIMLGAGCVLVGEEQIRKAAEARANGRNWIIAGYGDPLIRGSEVTRWRTDFCADGVDECRRYFPLANVVRNASSAVFRKDAYEAAGGADGNLRFCGDWKLWAGVALQGKMAYMSEPLNYYRLHPGSVWGNRSGAAEIQELLHVVRWVMEHATPTEAVREAASKTISFAWVMILMSLKVPVEQKRRMWRDIRAIDPHPLRRVLRPALKTVGMKIHRHWRELRSAPAPGTAQ